MPTHGDRRERHPHAGLCPHTMKWMSESDYERCGRVCRYGLRDAMP